MNPTTPRSIRHAAAARSLAASAATHVMFAIACLPWAVVAYLYSSPWLAILLVVAATALGHRAFLRAQSASVHMDLAFEAEALEARRSFPKL